MNDISKRLAALSLEQRALVELLLKKHPQNFPPKQVITPRSDRNGASPLSPDQERLWFIHQLNPRSPAYNINLALRLQGAVDVSMLQRALNEVIRRHEILRTYFVAVSGKPAQITVPSLLLDLPQVDLRSLPEVERETEAVRILRQHVLVPFGLTDIPLLRALLIRIHENEYGFLLTLHHIITDWWSFNLIQKELTIIYQAFVNGQPSPLPEPKVQYADFASWQRSWLQGKEMEELTAHWKQQLAGAPHVLELPTDRPRPAAQTFTGKTCPVNLPKPLYESLKSLSRQENATMYMAALAVFQLLLHRYTGQNDFLIGSPSANRNRAGTENMIGYLLNTMVLRAQLADDPPVREFLKRTRSVVLDAYMHQDMPFGELVAHLRPERDLSRLPLVQVSFVFLMSGEHSAIGELSASEVGGISFSPLSFDQGTARYDITFGLWETPEGLTGHLEYNTDLFDASTMRRMATHYRTLVESVVANPDARISELPMLSEAETHQLLVEWNETQCDYAVDRTLPALFDEQVERTPEAIAVVSGDERLTYAELNKRANQLAHHLRTLGVGADVLVGVLMERSVEMIVGLLGIVKAGGAYLPLDPSHPQERISYMLEDAGVTVLLTQQSLSRKLALKGAEVVCVDSQWSEISCRSSENPVSNSTADNLVYVIYTSGSTGQPKGVMLHHRGVVNYLSWCMKAYMTGDAQGAPVHSSVGFDLTVTSLFCPLLTGQRVVLVPEQQGIEGLSAALAADGDFGLVKITPSHLEILSHLMPTETIEGCARVFVIGGEAMKGESLSFWRRHAPTTRLINEYGPTETVVGCCVYEVPAGEVAAGAVPIGRPIANMQAYVLDELMKPLPVGVVGELYIGGAGVGRGYLNNPALTAERFVPNPYASQGGERLYRSGDMVRYLSEGDIEYVGRRDQQVKLRGFRIELGEVESALARHAGVRDVVVVVRGVDEEKQLVAYCVPLDEAGVSSQELRAYVRAWLPEYMVPGAFVQLDALPLTPNGKIDRRALPAPDAGSGVAGADYAAARTPVEAGLVVLWGQILRVAQPVGIHDNFFELGGHSLLATQLISHVREEFEVEVPLRDFFESPTVAGLAANIEQERETPQYQLPPRIVALPRGEQSLDELLAELDQLSDEDAQSILAIEMQQDN
jgi:amino acid adenylation domain-containing protein